MKRLYLIPGFAIIAVVVGWMAYTLIRVAFDAATGRRYSSSGEQGESR